MFRYFIITVLLFTSIFADTFRYGIPVPKTPLYAGAYIGVVYNPYEYRNFIIDDLALLLYGDYNRYHILGEIEASDIPLTNVKKSDFRIYIERLQLSWDKDEFSSITIGKFNSNAGFWNLTKLNTLTDTTSSPDLTETMFPELTTGLLYNGTLYDETVTFSLTLQHNPNLDTQYNNLQVDRHYAITLDYLGYTYDSKFTIGYFRENNTTESFYAGIAYRQETDYWTLQGELFTKQSVDKPDIPYNGYFQVTRHFGLHHDLIFRQEFYKNNLTRIKEGISLVGYTYRPKTSVALKTEYVRHSVLPVHHIIISASVIF